MNILSLDHIQMQDNWTMIALKHVVFACAVDLAVNLYQGRVDAIVYVLIYLLVDVGCVAPEFLVYVTVPSGF